MSQRHCSELPTCWGALIALWADTSVRPLGSKLFCRSRLHPMPGSALSSWGQQASVTVASCGRHCGRGLLATGESRQRGSLLATLGYAVCLSTSLLAKTGYAALRLFSTAVAACGSPGKVAGSVVAGPAQGAERLLQGRPPLSCTRLSAASAANCRSKLCRGDSITSGCFCSLRCTASLTVSSSAARLRRHRPQAKATTVPLVRRLLGSR